MATPSLVETVQGEAMGTGSLSLNTGAGTAVDDLLVAIHMSDYYAASGMNAPTGTAGTWAHIVTGDYATNDVHVKAWHRPVTAGGAQTVTLAPITDEDVLGFVLVLRGADLTTPVDGTPASNTGTSTTSHVAPSITTASTDARLIVAFITGNGSYSTFPPSGMTAAGTAQDGAPFCEGAIAHLALTSSGSTGTKTATFDAARNYAAISFAIQGAAPGGLPRASAATLQAVNRASGW